MCSIIDTSIHKMSIALKYVTGFLSMSPHCRGNLLIFSSIFQFQVLKRTWWHSSGMYLRSSTALTCPFMMMKHSFTAHGQPGLPKTNSAHPSLFSLYNFKSNFLSTFTFLHFSAARLISSWHRISHVSVYQERGL